MHFISVICPIYNEEGYIGKCIDSILEQDFPRECTEVLFVDGMSRDNTRGIVSECASKYSFIRLLDNPFKIVPCALNIGIKEAKGDVIIRLDAHAFYPSNYFSCLVDSLFALGADNVGGVCRTLPANGSSVCRAIAIALSSRFGMGNSYFRIGSDRIRMVDTVPFGCFRRDVFDRVGFFDEDLIRNQDDEFNGRIIKHGGKIFLIPSLCIDYFARDSFSKVCRMYFQYGLFKPLVNVKLGHPATIRQFFPVFFLCGLVIGGVLSVFSEFFLFLYVGVLFVYFAMGAGIGLKWAFRYREWGLFFLLPFAFLCVHLSYGWGYLRGIFKLLTKSSFNVSVNR